MSGIGRKLPGMQNIQATVTLEEEKIESIKTDPKWQVIHSVDKDIKPTNRTIFHMFMKVEEILKWYVET